MGEHVVHSSVFHLYRVALRIRVLRQQQRPCRACIELRHVARVESPHPRGQRIGVVAACRERRVRGRPPVDVGLSSAYGKDCAAVLSRHGQHASFGVRRGQPVRERRSVEPEGRRCRVDAIGAADHRRVGHAIHALAVRHNSRMHRESPRHGGGMPWRGFRYRVVLITFEKKCAAVIQPAKSTRQLCIESPEVVGAHLINREEDEQHRRRRRRRTMDLGGGS